MLLLLLVEHIAYKFIGSLVHGNNESGLFRVNKYDSSENVTYNKETIHIHVYQERQTETDRDRQTDRQIDRQKSKILTMLFLDSCIC